MKLLNQTVKYLSISALVIISLWAFVFYFIIYREIKQSIDEGLDNYKRQIIYNFQKDTSHISPKPAFDEAFFTLEKIQKEAALKITDSYIDTMLYMQDADDLSPELEPVRLLSTSFENNGQYYRLKIINPMVEEDDLSKAMFWNLLWLYLILIIGIILTNNFALQRLWKPFYKLISQLRNYHIDSSGEFPNVKTSTTEFKDLQQAVNTLLRQNAASFEKQKQFISHASHELQTPLAITANKLELLLENGKLSDNQFNQVASIIDTIHRLISMNKSLLLLSKIENKQFFDNKVVKLNGIVQKSLSDLEEFAAFKNLSIRTDEQNELSVMMDESLAGILVSNLLRNAIFHNIQNGEIFIKITCDTLTFSNTGPDKSLNSEYVFDAFYKDSANTKSSGLGLAIVKAICNLYQFNIRYRFDQQMHVFELNFKK